MGQLGMSCLGRAAFIPLLSKTELGDISLVIFHNSQGLADYRPSNQPMPLCSM